MNLNEKPQSKVKTFLNDLLIYIGKLLIKVGVVVLIGVLISYIVHYFKGFDFGSTMRIVGAIIACIGLSSLLGQFGIRTDYNYNMMKMRDSKIRELEHDGFMTASSLTFLVWMGTSGVILFLIGDAIRSI